MRHALVIVLAALLGAMASAAAPPPVAPTPTHANVSYGPHERNVFDIWLAKSDKPTPLLVYIHGGGWRGGDKSMVTPAQITFMLDHGVSVASVNYRYSTIAPLPAPVYDAARAIQFMRSKAGEWNLDKSRVAATGVSAGATTTLWLAFHDDLADPNSTDPVARESTRLCGAAALSGQTSIDPKVVVNWVGPEILKHGMIYCAVGAKNPAEVEKRYDEFAPLYREFSAYNHVDKSDPPVLMVYPIMGPLPGTNTSTAIHHAMLGQKLKEKADSVGARVDLRIIPEKNPKAVDEFLLEQLTK